MTNAQEKAIDVVNELIAVCKNGEMGFKTASESVKEAELQILCLQYAEQRAEFARELQEEVVQLGGEPESSGTVAGSLHRGWTHLKSAATGGDDGAIIAECERGEDEAKEAYEKALSAYMPVNITGVVQRQYTQIKAAHDRFSAMQAAPY